MVHKHKVNRIVTIIFSVFFCLQPAKLSAMKKQILTQSQKEILLGDDILYTLLTFIIGNPQNDFQQKQLNDYVLSFCKFQCQNIKQISLVCRAFEEQAKCVVNHILKNNKIDLKKLTTHFQISRAIHPFTSLLWQKVFP